GSVSMVMKQSRLGWLAVAVAVLGGGCQTQWPEPKTLSFSDPPTAVQNRRPEKPRIYRIVVAGQFAATADELCFSNSRLGMEQLIRRQGWVVHSDIELKTSILLLGTPPEVPPTPDNQADLVTRDDYNRRLAESRRWHRLADSATEHGVPIMNEVTFLHWIGYYPTPTGEATVTAR
ncbi:MAG: hypothetical protein PHU85_16480, partial [Phycisphaerae bacterium]|nr:hypothetical protein [Phycisphaerae bacterium]